MGDHADLVVRLQRLGAKAHASRALAADDREARDKAIETADSAGMAMAEIGRNVGLGTSQIQRILAARTAARQARTRRAAGV